MSVEGHESIINENFDFNFEHFDSPTTQLVDYYLHQRKNEYTSPEQVNTSKTML